MKGRIKQLEKQVGRKLEKGKSEQVIIYKSRCEIPELLDGEEFKIYLPDNNRDRKTI